MSPIETIGNELDMVAPPVPPPNIDPMDDFNRLAQPAISAPPVQPLQQQQQQQH